MSSKHESSRSLIEPLSFTSKRHTNPADEESQDHAVITSQPFIPDLATFSKDMILKFRETSVFPGILQSIVNSAKPPLWDALKDRSTAEEYIRNNDCLREMLIECIQQQSFTNIRNLEILQPSYDESPHMPPDPIHVANVQIDKSPHLSRNDTEIIIASKLRGFESYIESLATGKLDGYLDSIRCEDKFTNPDFGLPHDPILLLHDLGKHTDHERIKELFSDGTVHLFGISGSGKTRLSLDGLCWNWGIYITCRMNRRPASGSDDFNEAIRMLQTMSTWANVESSNHTFRNIAAVDCVFAMLLCTRVVILAQLVRHFPVNIDPMVARRRWVLAQVLPPSLYRGVDLFVDLLKDLRRADTEIMFSIIDSTLLTLRTTRPDLFPEKHVPLFVVIDEAQVAADHLKEHFHSTTGTNLWPILHDMWRFFQQSKLFAGIILSGNGLSMDMMREALSSGYAKRMDPCQVFTDIGRFTKGDSSQEAYVRRYLSLSNNDISDRRLLERIERWFSGRYRPTASLVELLLGSKKVSPHRVLTAFVKQLTGFKITDAVELEDGEPLISHEVSQKIKCYGQLCELECLFQEQDREELIHCLVNAFRRWTVGSELTSVPIEGDMHKIIAAGLGFLENETSTQPFGPYINGPVYISEALVILSLSSLFERHNWMMRRTCKIRAIRNAYSNSSCGFAFEDMALFMLMHIFGGNFNALAEAFYCNESVGSRRVTLVSLKREADGILRSHPVSWNAGSSDHFGFKAKSRADILGFLHDPNGKAFLFPGTHMGPDLLCFLQDEQTKELIVVVLQAKVSPSVNVKTRRSIIDFLMPRFFYTINEGKCGQHTPVSCPNIGDDLTTTLEMVLRPKAFATISNTYHSKSRCRNQTQRQSASRSTRQTPRFLCVVTNPDDKRQQKRLEREWEREWKGDMTVAVLRRDVVKEYIGSTAEVMNTPTGVMP